MKGGPIRHAAVVTAGHRCDFTTQAFRGVKRTRQCTSPSWDAFSIVAGTGVRYLHLEKPIGCYRACFLSLSRRMCHTHSSLPSRAFAAKQPGAQGAVATTPPSHRTTGENHALCDVETFFAGASTASSTAFSTTEVQQVLPRQHCNRRRSHNRSLARRRRQAPRHASTDGGGIDSAVLQLPQINNVPNRTTRAILAGRTLSSFERELCQLIQRGAWEAALELLHHHRNCVTTNTTTTLPHADSCDNATATNPPSRPVFHGAPSSGPTRKGQPTSNSTLPISVHEECLWLLLWHGHEAAAWSLWQTMITMMQKQSIVSSSLPLLASVPPLPFPSQSLSPSVSVSSARLALALALFLHFTVQDGQRTRDMLLAGELAWKAEKSAGIRKGLEPSARLPQESLNHGIVPVLSQCEETTGEVWWTGLFLTWLHCLVCDAAAAPRRNVQLQRLALHHIVSCVEANRMDDAAVVALLLLCVQEDCCVFTTGKSEFAAVETPKLSHIFPSSTPLTESPPAAPNATRKLVEEEFWRCAEELRSNKRNASSKDASRDVPSPISNDHRRRSDNNKINNPDSNNVIRQRVRTMFAGAARQLEQSRRRNTSSVVSKTATHRSVGLLIYRFWFRQLVKAMHCDDLWTTLIDATDSTALTKSLPSTASNKSLGRNTTASPQELQHINEATDHGDWAAALKLCLNDHFLYRQSVGAANHLSTLPWLHRLRKGLTACETAAKRSNNRMVPWQGALALWHLAQAHRSDCRHGESSNSGFNGNITRDSEEQVVLRRAYGRIFMLLASATRWREALRCFQATPTPCIDGFVVAQVSYALRASPEHCDRAVLEMWATWRCRCGDAAEPTVEMVEQLLQAMLHTSSVTPHLKTTTPVEAVVSNVASSAAIAGDVATGLLVAAAAATTTDTTNETTRNSSSEGVTSPSPSFLHLPGSSVPLDWRRQRHLVRRIFNDRWTGTWTEALQVALASADVPLLRSAASRIPPSALSSILSFHPSAIYANIVRHLRDRGVKLSASDRAALWLLWGAGPVRSGVDDGGVHCVSNALQQQRRRPLRDVRVRQASQDAERLLDELLGAVRDCD